MRQLFYYSSLTVLVMILNGCKTEKPCIRTATDSVRVVEKLVPVVLPPDSAVLRALLICNAEGRVIVHRLSVEQTKNAYLQFQLDSLGDMEVSALIKRDTLYLKQDSVIVSSVISKEVKVEKKLSAWQDFKMKAGGWLAGIVAVQLLVAAAIFTKKIIS